jgi:outer membrane lipoprotein-sorting protein
MSPHSVSNEQLVRFVLDELPSDKAGEIELHLRQCESCRRVVSQLKRLLACAQDMAAVPVEEHRIESANRAVLLATQTHSNDQLRRGVSGRVALFGRTIMSNRMMKLAVAAVVALAVIGGLSLFTGGGAGKVYANVVDQLHRAHTLTCSAVTMTGQEEMPTVRVDIAYKDPGYVRTATADGYVTVAQIVGGKIKGISIVPVTRTFVTIEADHLVDNQGNNPWLATEQLRALPTQADEALGRQDIEGRALEGFRVHKGDGTTTVWIDPKQGTLARVEMKFANTPGMNVVLSDFQFDVPLDDSLFRLEPPEGYTPVAVQADASQVTEQDFVAFLRLWAAWTKDTTFPPIVVGSEIVKITVQMAMEGKFVGPCPPGYDPDQQKNIMYRGMLFASRLTAGTWRYAGQNIRFGDPAVPIFWYQPAGAPAYRVIYADLHVADVPPESLPK